MVVLPLLAPLPSIQAEQDLAPARALIEFLSDGASPRPRLDALLLRDLATALADLASLARGRALVRVVLERTPWELGLERSGKDVLATLFQGGALPEVAVHEH